MNIIEIQQLGKKYKTGHLALDRMSLSVTRGQIMGFLGPNGAGKSTTINIIAGVTRKDSGNVMFCGEEINDRSFEYKRMIGFVLEHPVYFEKLTGKEYLEFAGSMYGLEKHECRKRTDELLEYFDLTDKQHAWIETYSNGMKKKASLAAALIHRPQLLILDEPLEGMDPIGAVRTKELLRDVKGKGTSVLIASHQLDSIEKLCDEISIIDKGRTVYRSSVADVCVKVKDDVTGETYRSLEELFVDLVGGKSGKLAAKDLSWPIR